MKDTMKAENAAGHLVAIDAAAIRECIVRNAGTVAEWVTARLVRDASSAIVIAELYADYESHCRQENLPPLLRKTWIATMKLAGFQTESGAFMGVAVKD